MGDLLNWLTAREVMLRLQISQTYVSQLMRSGQLHSVKTKLGWLVDPASVAAFEQERAVRQEKKGRKSATEGKE